MDSTSKIDFIAWGSEVQRVVTQLELNETYVFSDVTVNTCLDKYCSTQKGLQLVFTHITTTQPSTEGPFQSYAAITPLENVLQFVDKKVNLAGKICRIQKVSDKKKTSNKLIASIRDANIKLDTCFYGSAGENFTGKIGDVMILENVTLKNYGVYNVVNASKATCLINEDFVEIDELKNINSNIPVRTDLSPKKDEAEEVHNTDNFHGQQINKLK